MPIGVVPRPVVAAVVAAIASIQLVASWSLLHRPINVDESFTVITVRGGLSSLLSGVRADPGMAAYYVPLWLFRHFTGAGIVELRLVSFAFHVMVVAGICAWADRRGRLAVGAALALLLGLTPTLRVAAVEARAYALAELAAIAAVALVVRAVGFPTRPKEWGAAVGIGFLALVHPSSLGVASFLWLAFFFLAWRNRRVGLPHVATALIVAGAGFAGLMQAESSTSAARTGIAGLTSTLSALFGASLIAGVLLIAVVSVAVAFDGRSDPVAVVALGGALTYVGLCIVTLPLVDIAPSNPRYWVATAALVTLAGAVVGARQWRHTILLGTIIACLAVSVVRHDSELDRGYAFCSDATRLATGVGVSDQVIFEPPVVRSMVVACLDETDAASLRIRAKFFPPVAPEDMTDPRVLFLGAGTDLKVVRFDPPGHSWIIADDVTKPSVEHLLARFRAAGAACTAVSDSLIDCGPTD